MAAKLELVLRDDFLSDLSTLDLLGYTTYYRPVEDGYVPAVGDEDEEFIEDVIPLRVRANSHDHLADALQNIAYYRKRAKDYSEPPERYGLWLRAQLTNETGARQSFVKRLKHNPESSLWGRPTNTGNWIPRYVLGLERRPWWESTSDGAYTIDGINLVGGTYDYTTYGGSRGIVLGDMPARLALVKFYGNPATSINLYKFWLGFRGTRFGDRANFQSYWSLRKGAAFDADTTGGTTNADAAAKDGYKTITTFATSASLLRRVTIRVIDVTANPADQRGKFLVLLRAKLSATGTVRARLTSGFYGDSALHTRGRVSITSTDWNFYEMGTVTLPPVAHTYGSSIVLGWSAMGIDAERVSGSCALHMDCLVLIPIDDGFVYAENGQVVYNAGDTAPLYVMNRPDGSLDGVAWGGGVPLRTGIVKVVGGLPTGNGIAVAAGQRNSNSTLGDLCDILIQVYERWRELRGSG